MQSHSHVYAARYLNTLCHNIWFLIDVHDLLTGLQHDFCKGHSCEIQLIITIKSLLSFMISESRLIS